jgi:putative transposase
MRVEGQAITIERIEKDWLFLSFSKLKGWVKARLHRPLPDGFTLKNALLTSKADGWYITICLEDPNVPVFTFGHHNSNLGQCYRAGCGAT